MVLPDNPYEEKVTFHNVCKCDDINDIQLYLHDYNSDDITSLGIYKINRTYPIYEKHGYYRIDCYCNTCRCHISTHKFTPSITYKNSLINKHILSFLQFSQASYEDDIRSKTFKSYFIKDVKVKYVGLSDYNLNAFNFEKSVFEIEDEITSTENFKILFGHTQPPHIEVNYKGNKNTCSNTS